MRVKIDMCQKWIKADNYGHAYALVRPRFELRTPKKGL